MVCTLWACTSQTTKEQRIILATEHIEDPIRILEARAELEALRALTPASDELLFAIVPDALDEIATGSPAYQRALTEPENIVLLGAQDTEDLGPALEDVDPQRKTSAIKLYTQARGLRQTGGSTEAIGLLEQAARLDPSSASIQRELGDALIIANDHVGAIKAFERAIELGDRSPRALIHIASEASARGDYDRIILLTSQAMANKTINNHPLAQSIAGVLLGTAQINSGYLKAGAQTLGGALESFDTGSRDLRWRREIIQILNQRAQLWILTGDAWASIGAHQRAQDAYASAGQGVEHAPLALVARQIASSLRQGHPSSASLILLGHLQHNLTDLGSEELRWALALSEVDGVSDVLGAAIGELAKRPGITPSIRRSILGIQLRTLDPDRMVSVLARADLDANDPVVCLNALRSITDESDRIDAALAILDTNPSIARAIATGLTRTLSNPVEFIQDHPRPDTLAGELLVASVGIGLGRADLIGHLDSISVDDIAEDISERSDSWLGVHAQAMALAGKWGQVQPMIAELRSRSDSGNSRATRQLASALIITQQPKAAMELIGLHADDADADTHDLMLGAQIALMLGEFEPAGSFLERASELDPFDEKIYEHLFTIRSSNSPMGNEEELRFIVRQLGTSRPRSSLLGLIRANELARNGLINEAETLLLDLNTRYPYREVGYDLLLSIWKTHQTEEDSSALADGVGWLESRLEADPNSVQGMMIVAQGLFDLEQHQRAITILQDGYARTGSFELARAIEQLLAGPLDQAQEADQHLLDRLALLTGVDPTIEQASFLARDTEKDQSANMLALLRANLPTDIELLPPQRDQLAQIVFTLADTADPLHNESALLDLISVIEQRTTKLGFALSRAKLLLLAQQPELDMDRLIEVIIASSLQAETDDDRNTLEALPIQSLLGEDRPHEAIALIARFATHSNTLNPDYATETYRLLAAVGTNTDMIGVMDLLDERGLMPAVIDLTTTSLGTPERDVPAITNDQMRADLAYTAAALSTVFERDDQARSYYELALSYDPNHAWSNNDYGYMLAELGEQMDQAVEMLERAAKALPNEASVIDSLAWVRYKMGMFEDKFDENGQAVTPGAISLLIRATNLDAKRENATILLHLGDALWRGGYQNRANDAWLSAEDILRSRIRLLNAQSPPNPRAIEGLSSDLREVRYRLQDAESTGNPKLAPLAGQTDPN